MKKLVASVAALLVMSSSANAQVLNFEGITEYTSIGNHYNGGAGPNYGIGFFGNALALTSSHDDCNGGGNFRLQSSGCNVLFFLEGSATGMNRVDGFHTGFSLFYSSSYAGSVDVWSGLNGTGTLLGSLGLPETPMNGDVACGGVMYCPFVAAGLAFEGVAQSVTFNGAANYIAFDDITFGNATPGTVVPEPSTYALMAAGLGAVGFASRRRRKTAAV
jgi:hypothetical protein